MPMAGIWCMEELFPSTSTSVYIGSADEFCRTLVAAALCPSFLTAVNTLQLHSWCVNT